MGSIFGAKTPAPPPPAPPVTVRDEIGGVEQVPVTNEDGSVTYITRQIPLTAEQQAQKDELDSIMKESLAEIQKLSASDYANDEATQKVLDQWSTAQEKLLRRQLSSRTEQEEQALARRGVSDSSAANEVRRQRLLDSQEAETNLGLQKDEMGNQIRAERLALQQNLYNLASSQTDAVAARMQQAAIRGQSDVAALNAQRQASILDYYNAQLRGSGGGVFGNSFSKELGTTIGGAVGTSVGGPAGGMVGSMIGSLFAGR